MEVKFVSYDGSYPNLCSGTLILSVDGTEWKFPEYCLSSGGSVWFDDDSNEHIEGGEWSIREWPDGFPEDAKDMAVQIVNENVPFGCCGGCV